MGVSNKGVPAGMKNEKKVNLCFVSPIIVTAIKTVILIPKETIIDVPTVKL